MVQKSASSSMLYTVDLSYEPRFASRVIAVAGVLGNSSIVSLHFHNVVPLVAIGQLAHTDAVQFLLDLRLE